MDGDARRHASRCHPCGVCHAAGAGKPFTHHAGLAAVRLPDLSTPNGQAMIEPLLKGVDMVVLDNIATLCRTGKENESQSWQAMQAWLLDLRRRGITVLLIHHAGKSGDQRGTSAKEDIMDTVISLRRQNTWPKARGLGFI
ncbi:MAG: AAA family ATPase [Bilophila wadsworthia]